MKAAFINPLRWKKSFLFLLLTGFFVVWFSFIDAYSLKTRWQLSQQKKDLQNRTEELIQNTETLKQKIESLDNNPALLEKIAREEYGMRKPGETVYKIKKVN